MATRTIYVNPGDLLDIRVITDAEAPRTLKEWKYQVRPWRVLLEVKGSGELSFSDPALRVNLTDAFGKLLRACN